MYDSLDPTFWGLSELPELPGSLISFDRLGKFSFIMFSNKFSMSCPSSSPSGTPMIQRLECKVVPEVPKNLLIFFEFFLLYSVPVEYLLLPFVPNC